MYKFAIRFKNGENNKNFVKNMFKKGTALYSIFKFKCPKCHEGDFFIENNPFNLNKLSQMHEKCSNCDFRYEIEPNFFHGAMYVSYGLSIAIAIASFLISYIIGLSFIVTAIVMLVSLIVMVPVTFKLSRIIYANFFTSYKE